MSAVKNPLADLSDEQLVEEHSRSGVNSHYVSEMLRRHMKNVGRPRRQDPAVDLLVVGVHNRHRRAHGRPRVGDVSCGVQVIDARQLDSPQR